MEQWIQMRMRKRKRKRIREDIWRKQRGEITMSKTLKTDTRLLFRYEKEFDGVQDVFELQVHIYSSHTSLFSTTCRQRLNLLNR